MYDYGSSVAYGASVKEDSGIIIGIYKGTVSEGSIRDSCITGMRDTGSKMAACYCIYICECIFIRVHIYQSAYLSCKWLEFLYCVC